MRWTAIAEQNTERAMLCLNEILSLSELDLQDFKPSALVNNDEIQKADRIMYACAGAIAGLLCLFGNSASEVETRGLAAVCKLNQRKC
jgi:hypothetical protein